MHTEYRPMRRLEAFEMWVWIVEKDREDQLERLENK